jgi:hypothetical protein
MDRCPRLEATLWQRFAKVRYLGFPLETGIWAWYSRVRDLVEGSHTTSRSIRRGSEMTHRCLRKEECADAIPTRDLKRDLIPIRAGRV